MSEPRGLLVVPVAFRSDGTPRALELDDNDFLKIALDPSTSLLSQGYVWDGSAWQKLKSDSSGRLTLFNQTPASLQSSIFGYDGANQQQIKTKTDGKIMIDGDSPSLLRPIPKNTRYDNLSLPAGTSTQDAFTVPAGEYWRMTFLSYLYRGTVAGVSLSISIYSNPTYYVFYVNSALTSGVWNIINLNLIMSPGDVLRFIVSGATLNDDLSVSAFCERIY